MRRVTPTGADVMRSVPDGPGVVPWAGWPMRSAGRRSAWACEASGPPTSGPRFHGAAPAADEVAQPIDPISRRLTGPRQRHDRVTAAPRAVRASVEAVEPVEEKRPVEELAPRLTREPLGVVPDVDAQDPADVGPVQPRRHDSPACVDRRSAAHGRGAWQVDEQ